MSTTYYANDKYSAVLTSGYTVGQTTLYVSAVPNHVPTIIVAAKGTDNETIFEVTGKTTNSLTGVSRLRGANVDLDAQTPLTCLNNEEFINQYASMYNQVINGWNELGALTRVSDTTATLSGDWTDRLQKGDKLWWKSNGVSRYNYIIGISYSAPNTTITITGGYVSAANDSRFENGQTITEPRYSKVENPQGFPHWFKYSPTLSGGTMTISNLTGDSLFSVSGFKCVVVLNLTFTTSDTATQFVNVSLPITASNTVGGGGAFLRAKAGNSFNAGMFYMADANNVNFRTYDNVNWALESGRKIVSQVIYSI